MSRLKVTVANGGILSACGICRGVNWRTQTTSFHTEFFVLPLKGCDLVLVVQRLLSLGTIAWEFSSLTMQFVYEGQQCVLKGIQPGTIQLLEETQSTKYFSVVGQTLGPYAMVLTTPVQASLQSALLMRATSTSDELQLLLEYGDIFQEPTGLPSSHLQDHKIPLKDETSVVNIRPYRYPTVHKNEMRKLIQEMLQVGIIRTKIALLLPPL